MKKTIKSIQKSEVLPKLKKEEIKISENLPKINRN